MMQTDRVLAGQKQPVFGLIFRRLYFTPRISKVQWKGRGTECKED